MAIEKMVGNGKKGRQYRVCAAYDTETTNLGTGENTRAYPILFIINDIRFVDLTQYDTARDMDDIRYYRHVSDMMDYVAELMNWGRSNDIVPIIAAYNLMFDLQPLMYLLSRSYKMAVNAQTSTSAYTVDLLDDKGKVALRFWDTFYLEMCGLRAMGETCGLPKAVGDWDYSLVRTPETPLTDTELFYAGRDTQVIPAYLSYLLKSNEWLTADMLGCRVLTKTSLVRQMAYHEIGVLRYKKANGRRNDLISAFEMTCRQEFAKTFQQYALRKACFRGGLTFTSANYANRVWHNVVSLDVISMHHTFINGRMIPVHFAPRHTKILRDICVNIMATPVKDVLKYYYKPFNNAVHVRCEFVNLRVKKDTIFSEAGIGIIPEGKFTKTATKTDLQDNELMKKAEENIKLSGWHDRAFKPVFAFGKLMSAEKAVLHVNEVELWCISQVYDYDDFNVILGETTRKFAIPPDYVTLQSNVLFERKQDMKHVLKVYKEGEKYPEKVPNSIPEGIKTELLNGTANTQFLQSYYNSTVKGMFNGIYGTQAMDVMKPSFVVLNGDIKIDNTTIVNQDTYSEMIPDKIRVLYTYGMRIVAGSRMHLIIALELLHETLGDAIHPTGGDTDSIKASVAENVTDADLSQALKPLANASDMAINVVQRRNRANFPDLASPLESIGHFDIETAGEGTRWANHFEAWNKARISESDGHYHITCAGLSRPRDAYHIETLCNDLAKAGYTFEQVAPNVLGYNIFVANSISHSLQKRRPEVVDRFIGDVTDYLGVTSHVDVPQSIALYPSGRWLGETIKRASVENLQWLRRTQHVDTRERWIEYVDGVGRILAMDDNGEMTSLMETDNTDEQ